jgi:hypothetical protein
MATIAAGFAIKEETLHKRLKEMIMLVHDDIVERFVTSQAAMRFTVSNDLPDCGLIVDAKVQDRGRSAGRYEDVRKYYSGKHSISYLKSQVIPTRNGIAVHIVAGVPGAVHDMKLFRDNLGSVEERVDKHTGEPCQILADKGYIGEIRSEKVNLVTPHKVPARGYRSQPQLRMNTTIAQSRVVIENYFGRPSTKFDILVRRWSFDEELYPGSSPSAVRWRTSISADAVVTSEG